jgi:dienelactone hydrolase
MFEGDPAPFDLATPGFNATEWTLLHNPTVIDPILAKAVAYLQSKGITRIATTGYCFGGRYAFRLLASGTGVKAGFAAHPSLLEDGEITAITGPISVAAAGEFHFAPIVGSFKGLTCCRNRRHDAACETRCY